MKLLIAILFIGAVVYGQNDFITIPKKSLEAIRVTEAPVLDGILDDMVWQNVPIAKDFTINSPTPGLPSTQRTEVKVIYDNEALYVGATMYDVSRDSIIRQYSQRDQEDNTDVFGIFLDTYNDDQNGYAFVVHPTGVQFDARYSQEQGQDVTWNAVWLSEVSIDDRNWYVEMKIPYSAIRFPEQDVQDWGVNFGRKIRRIREFSFWAEVNPEINGLFNQFGDLEGIRNIEAPIRLALTPYVSSYLEHYPYNNSGASNFSSSFNGGMDIKYGLNDAFTLDMTLIPDFGQVQSDNQVLNLSPFEVQFNENRPFFMEGTELFNKGGLFYSRRLGGTPINFYNVQNELAENEEIVTNPGVSQLINAAKISGRTKGGLGVGVFNGVTKKMEATIRNTNTGETRQIETDPLTNYNVLVFDQNLKNNSYLTFVNTNVLRSGPAHDANVSSGLFKLNTKTNMYSVSGSGVLSQKFFADSVDLGNALELAFDKEGGNLTYGVSAFQESDRYDPNDLGFLYNNNSRGLNAYVGYRVFEPFWKFMSLWSSFNTYYERLHRPNEFVNLLLNADVGVTWKNWLSSGLFYLVDPFNPKDYFEPRVWGRVYTYQSSHNVGGWFSSDYRKPFALDGRMNYRKFNIEGRHRFNFRVTPIVRFSDRFSMRYDFGRSFSANDEGAAINTSGGSTILGDTIIFGKRDQVTYENVLNLKYIFTNRMGLTFRLRHYWSTVEYSSFHELSEEGYLLPSNYTGLDANGNSMHNTNFNAFNIDMVYTWVFAPGSEMSIVYKTSMLGANGNVAQSYFSNLRNTIESPQLQSLSLRILYYIDYQMLKRN